MVPDELTRALIDETTLDDISESYRPVVEIIGDLTSLYWMILRMMRMSTRRSRGRS